MMQQMNIRIDSDLKRKMEVVADEIGLGLNDVFRVFAKKFVDVRGFPFYLVSDNPNYKPEIQERMAAAKVDKSDFYPTTIDEIHKMIAA